VTSTHRGTGSLRWLAHEDSRWGLIWFGGLAALWIWDLFYLNRPALAQLEQAFVNTLIGAAAVVVMTLALGWSVGTGLYFLESRGRRVFSLALTFALNLVRSVPQMVGILAGYIVLTILIQREILQSPALQLLWMALTITLFTFLELADVIRERIEFYRRSDFFDAMLCSGIRESRIVNFEILWKNSVAHVLQKLIAIFGMAIFLQCSIDFIISVGLSREVSLSNFPVTLGGLLATLDSKQDILAISTVFTNPAYLVRLGTTHLQGISVAFMIVFTLLCVYKVSNGIVRRYRL
jgi:ABC-type dipeptide/oligopeptide/nickel transport system permease subunit